MKFEYNGFLQKKTQITKFSGFQKNKFHSLICLDC